MSSLHGIGMGDCILYLYGLSVVDVASVYTDAIGISDTNQLKDIWRFLKKHY